MITTATAILLPCLPLGIAAGVGWIRENRKYAWAREGWERACDLHAVWRAEAIERRQGVEVDLTIVTAERDKCKLRAEQYASAWGRVMRLLRLAEAELKTFRTAQLIREQAERVDAAADLQEAA